MPVWVGVMCDGIDVGLPMTMGNDESDDSVVGDLDRPFLYPFGRWTSGMIGENEMRTVPVREAE